jgi:putative endonuclease
MKTWVVYILRSTVTNRLYTGISNNVQARLKAHNEGRGAKATRPGRPWMIVYLELVADKSTALRREFAIKKLGLSKRLGLLRQYEQEHPHGMAEVHTSSQGFYHEAQTESVVEAQVGS